MASSVQIDKIDQPELAKHDPSILDLVFVMDCTSSMGPYIASALENIRSIVEEIVVSEKSDIHLALVEYRDHPPQDHTFVTRVHDFTARVNDVKGWLEQCQALGGGDTPEAVADGLYAALKLSWRAESTKICILIADAPPHGLAPGGDGFPNGCPAGLDPVVIVREMANKSITLYSVGVEPPIVPYREFFMSLAYITGGQYVPMINAKLLAKVIVGGVREEISLDRLMQNAQADINREMQRAEAEGVDEKEKIKRMQDIFVANNLFSTQMKNPFGAMSSAVTDHYSRCTTFGEMRSVFVPQPAITSSPFSFGALTAAPTTSLFGPPTTAPSASPFTVPTSATTSDTFSFGAPTTAPTTSLFGPPVTAPTATFPMSTAASSGFTFGAPVAPPTTSPFGTGTTASTSIFPTSTTASTSIFPTSTTASSTFSFGAPNAAPTNSIFGMPSTTSAAFTSSASSAEPTYTLAEQQVVNEDQAARMYQKWQNRNK